MLCEKLPDLSDGLQDREEPDSSNDFLGLVRLRDESLAREIVFFRDIIQLTYGNWVDVFMNVFSGLGTGNLI